MIDDNFNDPVTAYLKGKAIQEKKAPKEKEESSMAINERFEIMAELFHAATGFLAPGKSAPPELQTEQYGIDRQAAWGEWSDTKALNMAIKFIQALRNEKAEYEQLYTALELSDTNQLRQERDALRLRIKAVDEEHVQLAEERKKMIDAYTKVEEQKNFWEREHKALMETCLTTQKRLDQKDADFTEEMKRGFADLQRVEKERDQYKKLWTIRGKALEQPCLSCGYTGNQIRMQNGEIP